MFTKTLIILIVAALTIAAVDAAATNPFNDLVNGLYSIFNNFIGKFSGPPPCQAASSTTT